MKTLFFHRRAGKRNVTVCAISIDGMLYFHAAKCMATDHFSRKIGNSIALGRLKRGRCLYSVKDQKGNFEILSRIIAKDVASNGEVLKEAGRFVIMPETVVTKNTVLVEGSTPEEMQSRETIIRYLQPKAHGN